MGDSKKGTGASGLKFSLFGRLGYAFYSFSTFVASPLFFSISSFYLFYFYSWVPLEFSQLLARNGQKKGVKGRTDNEVVHTHHCEAASDNLFNR
jgi:hypothetical protein